jgi:hypothetical protein
MNVTIGMTPEMVEKIDDEAEERGWSRAKAVRYYIRTSEESPIENEAEE